MLMVDEPIEKEMPFEPSASTRMTAAMIVFLDFEKSTFASTTLRTPTAEIIP